MKEKNDKLIIIGAGSLGVMTLDAAIQMNIYEEILFVDDNKKKGDLIHGYEVIGGQEVLERMKILEIDTGCVIAIANNSVREKIAEEYNLNYVTVIHPKAVISDFAEIGIGNIILANTSIDPNVRLYNHVIINKNNSIGHDSILHSYSQVSPGSSFGGFTIIEKGVFMGLGSVVLPSITVGEWSTIGASALVTKDIPNRVTAVGVPARIVKGEYHAT